jgi:hypothetical protein
MLCQYIHDVEPEEILHESLIERKIVSRAGLDKEFAVNV